jgi:acetylornithine deacetylase/succinyl-diaminopimelate desuccinylase-like protein
VATGNPVLPGARSTTPVDELAALLKKAGAAVALRPSAYRDGIVGVTGSPATSTDAVPTIVVAGEQYNVIARLAAAGRPVSLRVELTTRYFEEDSNSYNVIAEIPGADRALRDQVVLLGAHLDSWHTASGATDNADGAVAAMEAMRILRALKLRPRRTIRVALWSGEEQGLQGPRHRPRAPRRGRRAVDLVEEARARRQERERAHTSAAHGHRPRAVFLRLSGGSREGARHIGHGRLTRGALHPAGFVLA